MKQRLPRLLWLRSCGAAVLTVVLLLAAADARVDGNCWLGSRAADTSIPSFVPIRAFALDPDRITAVLVIGLLLVAFAVEWIVHRRRVRRMQRLLDRASNVIDDEVVSCARELAESHEALIEELNVLRTTESRLRAAQAALEETTQRVAWLSELDPISELPNRRRFDEVLAREWRRASDGQQPLSLLWVGIDCFKQFSETYGQSIADDCLRAIADVLAAAARRSGSLIARIGGEEFAVLLSNADGDAAMDVARLIQAMTEQLSIEHETTKVIGTSIVTVSIGVAVVRPDASSSPSLLLFHADESLYAAQVDGRNCIRSYEESTGTRLRAPTLLSGEPANCPGKSVGRHSRS
jgi:diguanylate cyclase (GGDEF)-like protein